MYDTFLGLPLHVLLLHAVVVLVPIGAAASAAVFLRAQWRRRFATVAVTGNVVLLALTFVTVQAGQKLQNRFIWTGDMAVPRNDHETFGRALLWLVLALTVVTALALLADRRGVPAAAGMGIAVVVGGLALASTVLTVLAGHTGSQSHWEDFVDTTDSVRAPG